MSKIEVVESGITDYETELALYTVMPDGSTVGDAVLPQLAAAFGGGGNAPLLLRAGP